MQAQFPHTLQEVNAFHTTLGNARFDRYIRACNGDQNAAVALYMWNARISQAFYLPLQIWEVGLRNQINRFLVYKYGRAWPYDNNAIRQLHAKERDKLRAAKERQERDRATPTASTDAIVADLSAGFWVALLAHRYAVPLAWHGNLLRVFPRALPTWHTSTAPIVWDAAEPHAVCERILKLRNRVAHHEAILEMDLSGLHFKIAVLTHAMCPASFSYMRSHCTVQRVLAERP